MLYLDFSLDSLVASALVSPSSNNDFTSSLERGTTLVGKDTANNSLDHLGIANFSDKAQNSGVFGAQAKSVFAMPNMCNCKRQQVGEKKEKEEEEKQT